MKFTLSPLISILYKSRYYISYMQTFFKKSQFDSVLTFSILKQIYSISINNILVIAVFFHRIKEKDNEKF